MVGTRTPPARNKISPSKVIWLFRTSRSPRFTFCSSYQNVTRWKRSIFDVHFPNFNASISSLVLRHQNGFLYRESSRLGLPEFSSPMASGSESKITYCVSFTIVLVLQAAPVILVIRLAVIQWVSQRIQAVRLEYSHFKQLRQSVGAYIPGSPPVPGSLRSRCSFFVTFAYRRLEHPQAGSASERFPQRSGPSLGSGQNPTPSVAVLHGKY